MPKIKSKIPVAYLNRYPHHFFAPNSIAQGLPAKKPTQPNHPIHPNLLVSTPIVSEDDDRLSLQ